MKELALTGAPFDLFEMLAVALLFGYLLMSRSFAHWGIAPLYVGEAALGAFLMAKPISLARPWLHSMTRPSLLSGFGWCLAISLAYGILQCVYTLFAGIPKMSAEIFVFHLYPLYLFPGLWVGMRHPKLLPRVINVCAWIHGVYGLLFITVFAAVGLTQTYDDPATVGLLGHPNGGAILLLGLIAYERNLWRSWIPMMLNVLVLIGMQRRAEWIGFLCAITVWACLSGRVKRLMVFGALAGCVLLIGLLPDVRFPSPSLRGDPLSTRDIIGRAIAPIWPDAAEELTSEADSHAATAEWRSDFWNAIWKEVHLTPSRAVFGLGYDYPLWRLHPMDLDDNPVRTPHSVFMFVLSYSGWLGVFIFAALQLALGRMLWRVYRATGDAFGISLWVLANVWAMFDPFWERPMGAIPIYLLLGLAAARIFTVQANHNTQVDSNPQ